MIKKYSFTLLLAFFFCQIAFGQLATYVPSWTNYLGQTPKGNGETNSSGEPIGLWSFYATTSYDQDKPTETFNYDNHTNTHYGRYGILLETGRLNSDFKRTGEWREYNESSEFNHLKKKGKYYDGLKHGKWDVFSLDSLTPIGYENYTNGVPSGRWVTHNSKGEVISEENFKNGKYEGTVIKTKPYGRGKQRIVSTYVAGVKNGEEKRYLMDNDTESTTISRDEGTFSDGHEVGEWRTYNIIGDLTETVVYPSTYTDGSPIEVKKHYSTGEILTSTPYKDFQRHGTMVQYYRNGKVQMKLIYDLGRIMTVVEMKSLTGEILDGGNLNNGNGTLKEYDENSLLTGIYEFEKSIMISHQTYEKGELIVTKFIYDGENDFKEIYYEDGQKIGEVIVKGQDANVTHFENDIITKKEIYFREELVKTILYENGEAVQTIEE